MSVSAVQEILNAEAEARKIKEAASAQAKKTVADAHAEGEKFLAEAENKAALEKFATETNTPIIFMCAGIGEGTDELKELIGKMLKDLHWGGASWFP